MSYPWNTKFSTEYKQETRDLRRVETYDVTRVREKVIPAILALGITPILTAVQPGGTGTGIAHYRLMVVTKGDDWAREEQFRVADRLANSEVY